VNLIQHYDCSHTFLSLDTKRYQNLATYYHLTQATYYRTTLPDLLEESIQRILYLDCDVIVEEDIRGLYNYSLDGKIIGAVENPEFDRYHQLNIPPEHGYFNAGILLIDVVGWKQYGASEKIMELLAGTSGAVPLKFGNQDSFNAVLHDQWKPLPVKWNVQREMFKAHRKNPQAYPEAANPAIIHYTSSWKPWDYLNDHPFKDKYFKYLQRTPWKNDRVTPKDFTPKNVVKKLLRRAGVKSFQKEYW
jgi:lipopolysaccharide biosynthesis glycosyltransferase